jgi:hypothetical protein
MRATMCGWTCLVLCAGWTLTLTAQGPQTLKATAEGSIMVTGCIAESKSAAANTGAAPAVSDSRRFTLTNAAVVESGADAAAGKPVTTQAKPTAARQYRLDGSDSMLAPHVNHRVRITGSLEQPQAGGAASQASGPMLKVDSVFLLEPSCS